MPGTRQTIDITLEPSAGDFVPERGFGGSKAMALGKHPNAGQVGCEV